MELEVVRTVLKNEVNEIYVCTNLANHSGEFYTMIAVTNVEHRKILADKMNNSGLFFGNKDFIGSFLQANQLNLVFRYYHENLLSLMGNVYLYQFAECKETALSMIATVAETNLKDNVGLLLLEDRNINITKEGEIVVNYFLDFEKLGEEITERDFFKHLGARVFAILEQNYKEKYSTPELYPDDLQVFYLRMKNVGFTSYGQMISVIRDMANKPIEMKGFLWWIRSRFLRMKGFLFKNSMNAFLTILILVTLIYGIYNVTIRLRAYRAYNNSMSYYGVEEIGGVYLGNEE